MEDELATLEVALLDDLPALAALRAAFRTGLIDRLAGRAGTAAGGTAGDALLLGLLAGAGATERTAGGWTLSAPMRRLLARDGKGLRARAEFTAMAAADLLRFGEALAGDPRGFLGAAETFRFFAYRRAMGTGASHLEDTAPWVAYVTALSAREAPALAPLVPLDGCARLLEIGGNTGEMALALLALHPGLEAVILDLPAVCRLGATQVAGRPGAERLRFLPGDARETEWPAAEAVLFKSVLHDWTETEARGMLARAAAHVPPGGRVIVCERGAIAEEPALHGARAAANLVFASFYRPPSVYEGWLADLGLAVAPRASLQLDMTFHMAAGRRAA